MKPKDLNMAVKFKKSNNQNTTVRDRVKLETGKTTKSENICRLNVDGKLTSNHQEIVDTFNIHVLSVAKSINTKKKPTIMTLVSTTWTTLRPITICYNLLRVPFQTLNLSYYQLGNLRI